MPTAEVCVEQVSEGFVALAFRGSRLVCNTIPLESERSALRRLRIACEKAWGRVKLKRNPFCGPQAETVASLVNRLYLGDPVDAGDVQLEPPRSESMRRVLLAVSAIPRGRVTTYGALAKAVGLSPRVVGSNLGRNPYPLLVPCHRVVRSDLTIGGYSYGRLVKAYILMREGVEIDLETGKVDRRALLPAWVLKGRLQVALQGVEAGW